MFFILRSDPDQDFFFKGRIRIQFFCTPGYDYELSSPHFMSKKKCLLFKDLQRRSELLPSPFEAILEKETNIRNINKVSGIII